MGASDVWVRREGGKLIRREENDGWTFMNRGAEAEDREIIGIGGFYQVIVAGGHKMPIRYCGDWETIVKHFTEPTNETR